MLYIWPKISRLPRLVEVQVSVKGLYSMNKHTAEQNPEDVLSIAPAQTQPSQLKATSRKSCIHLSPVLIHFTPAITILFDILAHLSGPFHAPRL